MQTTLQMGEGLATYFGHAKEIGGPKSAMLRGNRGRSNRKEEVYGDLSCQKSQNAFETGGKVIEKKERGRRFRRKNKKYILKKFSQRGGVKCD